MIGLVIASQTVFGGIACAFSKILSFVPPVSSLGMTAWFDQNLAAPGFSTTWFVMFAFVSNVYKLCKRDDIVPYHVIAEDYFEKNFKREQDYLHQQDAMLSNITD